MKKENTACAIKVMPIGRITRARAVVCNANEMLYMKLPLVRPNKRSTLLGKTKRDKNNCSAPTAAPQCKKRTVLKDVTNICSDLSTGHINATKLQDKVLLKLRPCISMPKSCSEHINGKNSDYVPGIYIESELFSENHVDEHLPSDQKWFQDPFNSCITIQNEEHSHRTGCEPDGHARSVKEGHGNLSDMDIVDIDSEHTNPLMCSSYSREINSFQCAAERFSTPDSNFMETVQKDVNQSMRSILIDWLVEVSDEYRLVPDTLYLAVNFIDRYLSENYIERQRLPGGISLTVAYCNHDYIGPNLTGLFGRCFGASCDTYSTTDKDMPLAWEESALQYYLLDSIMDTPVRKMDVSGMKKSQEHSNLMTYLKDESLTHLSVSSPKTFSSSHRRDLDIESSVPYSKLIKNLISSIRNFSMQGQISEAFNSFSLLRRTPSDSIIFLHPISSLISTSSNLKAISQGKQVHSHTISLGLSENFYLISRLSSFYSAIGLIYDAKKIVEYSKPKQALPWNFLISAYIRNGFWLEVILAYKKMLKWSCEVDKFTYPSVISACSESLNLDVGRIVHGSVQIYGLQHDLFICNALISMYSKCGLMKVARKLFDFMHKRDIVTWNTLISGYVSKKMFAESFELLEKIQLEDYTINVVTWNIIASTNSQLGSHLNVLEQIASMSKRNTAIDSVSLVIGLNSCSRLEYLGAGKEIHGFALRLNFNELENVTNALITMYSRCKHFDVSHLLFRTSTYKSLIKWNAIIAGFASGDLEDRTFSVFQDMIGLGIQPNYVTMVTTVSLCARVKNLEYGRELHCYITKNIFSNYNLLENSLINMYSKLGKILVAQKLFRKMCGYDEVTYTSMIYGYGMHGEGVKALKLFHQMIACGIIPDGITMVAVLSACGHSRLVTQGKLIFEKMRYGLYGVMPQMEHYSCMVDLYIRAGLLRDAEEFINQMPFEPSRKILATLVRGCLDQGCIVIGERSAKWLLEMRSNDQNHYILIANMFLYCRKWKELSTVSTFMKEMGIVKINIAVSGLHKHMSDFGYVGNDSFGILDDRVI